MRSNVSDTYGETRASRPSIHSSPRAAPFRGRNGNALARFPFSCHLDCDFWGEFNGRSRSALRAHLLQYLGFVAVASTERWPLGLCPLTHNSKSGIRVRVGRNWRRLGESWQRLAMYSPIITLRLSKMRKTSGLTLNWCGCQKACIRVLRK